MLHEITKAIAADTTNPAGLNHTHLLNSATVPRTKVSVCVGRIIALAFLLRA